MSAAYADLFGDQLERDRAAETRSRGRAAESSSVGDAAGLARRTDPATSQAAAARSRRWVDTHEDRILGVLWRPMTAAKIGQLTGLTVVQVDRRLPELQAAGRVRLTGAERDGFREWEKVIGDA